MTPDRARGRPRDPDLEANVLEAALVEYGETGWNGFTMDGVGRRAKVGKSSLYRRWTGKEELLVEAIEANTRPLTETDTGSFAGDALDLATNLMRHFCDPAGWVTLRIAVDAPASSPIIEEFHERIVRLHDEAGRAMVARAIARGELPDDAPVQSINETLFGSVLVHALALTPRQREAARQNAEVHVAPLVEFVLRCAALPTT